jgi:hypothetical protein
VKVLLCLYSRILIVGLKLPARLSSRRQLAILLKELEILSFVLLRKGAGKYLFNA